MTVAVTLAIALAIAVGGTARTWAAEMVVASLSHHDVSLTTGFAGSELFVYGAVRRTDAVPEPLSELNVIITITGPDEPVEVRKKERRFGIWTNGPGVLIDSAPSFYVVASSGSFRETVTWTDDLRYRIGLEYAIQLIDAPAWAENREEYRVAVARVREAEGLYSILPNAVKTIENTLFETRIELPADLTEGDYTASVYLVRDKQVLDVFTDTIEVRRAPLGRFVYMAAQEYAALYGLVSLALALAAGWLASAFFRAFFPT